MSKAIVAEADDVDQLDIDALPSGGQTHELALMSSCPAHARDDLVTADEDVLRVHAQIGKRRRVPAEELLDPFLAGFEPVSLVLDEVIRDSSPNPSTSPALSNS